MLHKPISIDDYKAKAGGEIGISDWVLIDQARIDKFADLTGDHQFIHVDPERARTTPLGGTIAHGYLTLSLLSQMSYLAIPGIAGTKMRLNYGFDRLRFIAPVRAGKRVRGRFVLKSVTERTPGRHQITLEVTVEIEGEDKPALVADWILLAVL